MFKIKYFIAIILAGLLSSAYASSSIHAGLDPLKSRYARTDFAAPLEENLQSIKVVSYNIAETKNIPLRP